MAIINLPGQSRSSMLGSSIGTGLGKGLELLLQDKLNTMVRRKQQEQTSSALEALNFSPEQAQQLSGLEPTILKEVINKRDNCSYC